MSDKHHCIFADIDNAFLRSSIHEETPLPGEFVRVLDEPPVRGVHRWDHAAGAVEVIPDVVDKYNEAEVMRLFDASVSPPEQRVAMYDVVEVILNAAIAGSPVDPGDPAVVEFQRILAELRVAQLTPPQDPEGRVFIQGPRRRR